MTRIMRDSTTAADIPVAGTQLVAGYANGRYRWTDADYRRFPDAAHVYIDVIGNNPRGAGVLDIENGAATVADAPGWSKTRLAMQAAGEADYPPILYANRSTLTPLFNEMDAHGYKIVRDFRLWIATLDGTRTVPDMTGVTAVQYAGQSITGGHYDESIVYDDSWHRAAPAPPPAVLRGYLVRTDRLTVKEVTSRDGHWWM